MKAGPVAAMIGLLAVGVWLVLQPALESGRRIDPDAHRFAVVLGAEDVRVEQRVASTGVYEYHFVGGEREALGWISAASFEGEVAAVLEAWETRPAFGRTLLGFFNISSWVNFAWVAVGLLGQAAFFGRMMIQWVVSEKQRQSVVPELFWWLSLFGGVSLFTYFVWRTDIVGVLGQSTGVVVYARNLRLIRKQRRREQRALMTESEPVRADEA
ncbi:MAG: lipid-A-disaccharide synthase N-terminal domain-containing protein [Planctomycetota bacterium]